MNSSSAQHQTGPTESESLPPRSKLTSSRKPRIEGIQRYEYIEDDKRRKKSQSKQIKQIKIDVMRLLLTTGTHSALLVISPSLKVHKFATAGDFDSFLEMYAALLSAQQKKHTHTHTILNSELTTCGSGSMGEEDYIRLKPSALRFTI